VKKEIKGFAHVGDFGQKAANREKLTVREVKTEQNLGKTKKNRQLGAQGPAGVERGASQSFGRGKPRTKPAPPPISQKNRNPVELNGWDLRIKKSSTKKGTSQKKQPRKGAPSHPVYVAGAGEKKTQGGAD